MTDKLVPCTLVRKHVNMAADVFCKKIKHRGKHVDNEMSSSTQSLRMMQYRSNRSQNFASLSGSLTNSQKFSEYSISNNLRASDLRAANVVNVPPLRLDKLFNV